MTTIFLINAHKWCDRSMENALREKFFQSWVNTIPARLNFLADAITNLCSTIFSTIKVIFYSWQSFYTWGLKTQNLKKEINNLYENFNNLLSSSIGIISTSYGKNFRSKNNLNSLFYLSLSIGLVFATIFGIKNIQGFEISYDSSKGVWDPSIYWDLSKKKS